MTQSQLGEISFEGLYYTKLNEISLRVKCTKIEILFQKIVYQLCIIFKFRNVQCHIAARSLLFFALLRREQADKSEAQKL